MNTLTDFIRISQHEINARENLDVKLKKAAQMGFFYIEMPEECKKLLNTTVEYANTFFRLPEIQDLKLDMPSGFRVQNHTQNERLILEDKYWNEFFSEDLVLMAKKMHETGLKILTETLRVCNIPEDDWELATGGAANANGKTFMTFNRYNPERQANGLNPHRDFGQITVLFINQKGLQAKIDGVYQDVAPLDGHFIVNFGRALETYINNPEELTASWHRVQQVAVDRVSFGIFMDNQFNLPIYQRNDSSNVIVEPTFGAYLEKLFKEVHQGQ